MTTPKLKGQLNPAILAQAQTVRALAEKVCKNKRLRGICSPCSVALALALQHDGFPAIVVQGYFGNLRPFGDSHVWVEVEDYIVDVTATQFRNVRPVFVVSASDKRYFKEAEFDRCEGLLKRLSPWCRSIFFAMAGRKYNLTDLWD